MHPSQQHGPPWSCRLVVVQVMLGERETLGALVTLVGWATLVAQVTAVAMAMVMASRTAMVMAMVMPVVWEMSLVVAKAVGWVGVGWVVVVVGTMSPGGSPLA